MRHREQETPLQAPAEPPTERQEQPVGLRDRAVRGVMWTAVEKWSVRLSTFVGFVLLGRLLGPEEFGIVALAMTFITILTVVTDAGFSTYLVHVQRLTATTTSTAFYISALIGVVLTAGLVAVSSPLSDLLGAEALRQVLPALAVSLLVAGLASVPAALLTRELRFRQLALRQVAATLLSVVVAVALAVGGAGVWALVAQTLVRSAVSGIALALLTDFRPRLLFSGREAWRMLAFGSKTVGARIGGRSRDQAEALIIGAVAGPAALGLWVVAGRLVGVVVDLCSSVVTIVAGSVFARLQDDPERLARALRQGLAAGAFVMVPVLVALSLVSPVVVPALFGEQWVPAAAVAAILAIRSLVAALTNFDHSVLLATGRPGLEMAITYALLAVHVVLVWLFAEQGLVVLAWVVAAEVVLAWPVRPLVLRRTLGIPLRTYGEVFRILAAGGCSAAVVAVAIEVTGVGGLGLVVLVVLLGAAAYTGAALLLCRRALATTLSSLRGGLRRRSEAPTAG